MKFEDIEASVRSARCISFDVFDTLLLRPFMRPTDLFAYVGGYCGMPEFRDERVSAEKRCKRSLGRGVTLDEIYGHMDGRFLPMKEEEISAEIRTSVANPEILPVFQQCLELGKKVILVSDMYLPGEVIGKMLRKNGIEGYRKLYISCEHGAGKHEGKLYDLIISDLGLKAEDILHIGNNAHSDFKVPRLKGINAVRYESPCERYARKFPREYRFCRRDGTAGSSAIVAADMMHWLSGSYSGKNYWYGLGHRFGGPTVSYFVNFMMCSIPSDTERIFFVSRDGYNARNIYRILCDDPLPNNYVHASRYFSAAFGDSRDDRSHVRIAAEYRSKNPSGMKMKYQSYILKEADGAERIVIVDATTMKYSAQRLLNGALGNSASTTGCYFHVLSPSDLEHIAFRDCSRWRPHWTVVNITEFFLGSPEYPIRNISDYGEPIYTDDISDEEKFRAEIYGDVADGESDYAVSLKQIFGERIPEVSGETIAGWLRTLASNSRRSGDQFSEMRCAPDAEHRSYVGLIFGPGDILYALRRKAGSLLWKIHPKE
jgi:predicted HAD superfamily hydrolase